MGKQLGVYVAQMVVLEDGDAQEGALSVELHEEVIGDPHPKHDSAGHILKRKVQKSRLEVA